MRATCNIGYAQVISFLWTRGFPLLLLRVDRGDGNLHDDVEQIVALPSDGSLREGNDEL